MADYPSIATLPRSSRSELCRHAPDIPLASLVVGVDNIHHDVFLSPKFVEATRVFLFDLIRQTVKLTHFPGFERKPPRAPETAAFRKMLNDILQASLTNAKYAKNIEHDVLLHVALLKLFTQEIVTRFADLLLEAKEGIRNRGPHFERSEEAHVLKSRLAEMQANRRETYRQVGQQIHQIWTDLEESSVARARKALIGEEAARAYSMFSNRLVFVEGGRDDRIFLENYVMLGNYPRDPDRFEIVEQVLFEMLREVIFPGESRDQSGRANQAHSVLLETALRYRTELAQLDDEREVIARKLGRSEGLIGRTIRREDPAELRASVAEIDCRRNALQEKLDLLAPQIESSKQKLEFLDEQHETELGEYLNEPANAKRLFDVQRSSDADPRFALLEDFVVRLEQKEILPHVMASYEVRNLQLEYSPPVHLQQLRKALVSREELKRVEAILKQFPARQFSLKPMEDSARRLRRLTREEQRSIVRRFVEDFMRLRRDLSDYQRLVSAMERVSLVRAERTREVSRMNRTLYEFLLPEEEKPADDHVVSHAVIKADVRGSTKMTQDLLSRGLNPASHLSLNLYEPIQKVLDRFGATKVFVEGDAIILAIYETESNRTRQRAVAKSCLLARQIVGIAQAYNQRSETTGLPRLELGVGLAFQNSPPTFWMDKDSRIMISRALNLSDRLSSCSKAARRLLGQPNSPFRLFVFQTTMEGITEEELDEFILRYNMNGVELNEEGFLKLGEEISLTPIEAECQMPWGRERATFFSGLVPIGDTLEPLYIRKGHVRQLLPDGKIGAAVSRAYYEVCTNPDLLEILGVSRPAVPKR